MYGRLHNVSLKNSTLKGLKLPALTKSSEHTHQHFDSALLTFSKRTAPLLPYTADTVYQMLKDFQAKSEESALSIINPTVIIVSLETNPGFLVSLALLYSGTARTEFFMLTAFPYLKLLITLQQQGCKLVQVNKLQHTHSISSRCTGSAVAIFNSTVNVQWCPIHCNQTHSRAIALP